MNMEKVYIDENTWFIDNFLTQEELDWFKPWMDDPKDWYTTMRSPYKNILNKFIGNVNKYDENGDLIFPTGDNEFFDLPIFSKEGGIWERLHKVLPPHYRQHATLQTFKYMTDNEIQENLTEETRMHLRGFNENGTPSMTEHPVDFAMWWHEDTNPNQPTFNMSFSLYLNVEYKYKLKKQKNTILYLQFKTLYLEVDNKNLKSILKKFRLEHNSKLLEEYHEE